ncbi:MAG: hypothetical protein ACOC04_03185 [Halothece sp.]
MDNKDSHKIRWAKRKVTFFGAIALGVTTLLLPGCEVAQEGPEGNVTTGDVVQDTEAVVGQEITVRSLVDQAIGESGFVLETDTGEPIVVINATGVAFDLPQENIPVQATGEVMELVIADLENQYGLDLEDELYVDYETEPVIVAESLALAPTPDILAEQPEGYFDQVIAVEGDLRKLEDTPNAFALFEEGWIDDVGVLVIGVDTAQEQGTPLEEGGNVTVTGVARELSPELIEQNGLDWTPEQIEEFQARYSDRPVIIADGVYPSAVDPAPGS